MPRSALVTAVVSLGILAGCTAQVSNTALNMQESYKTLLMKQILYNLGEADRDGELFFPSQIIVSAGTAQSANSITPTVSLPLPGVTTTGSASSTTSATTLGSTQQIAWGAPGISLGFSDSWQLNWGLTPRNDPDELSRLRALYRYATGNIPFDCRDKALAEGWLKTHYVMQGGRETANPAFTQQPNCVLCQDSVPLQVKPQSKLEVNPDLVCGFISTKPKSGFIPFDRYGFTYFYLHDATGREGFIRFTFFILEAMSNTPYTNYTLPTKAETEIKEHGIIKQPIGPSTPMIAPGPQPPKIQSITPFSLPLGN